LRQLTDIFKQELNAGDFILYTVSHGGGSMTTRLAIIDNIIDNGNDAWYRYQLKVRAFEQDYLEWHREAGEYSYTKKDRFYRATLTSNKTIVKLNKFTLPEGFKKLIQDK
jgi:hypothetical protein